MSEPTRRDVIAGVASISAASAASYAAAPDCRPEEAALSMTCIIRYQIDPFQREEFKKYAASWGRIIPRCGGHLIGYFLPDEGTNDVAWGLIAFASLAAYEAYRARLKLDPQARENFAMSQSRRLVLREERNFVSIVAGTFELPAKLTCGPTEGHEIPRPENPRAGAP